MKYIIGAYVVGMMLFWISGEGTTEWNMYYYSLEKIFSASGFILLAYHSENNRIIKTATYAFSVCIFMFAYFIWCMLFGHSSLIAVTSFVFYSIIILYLIDKR